MHIDNWESEEKMVRRFSLLTVTSYSMDVILKVVPKFMISLESRVALLHIKATPLHHNHCTKNEVFH